MKVLKSWRRVEVKLVRESADPYQIPIPIRHAKDLAELLHQFIDDDPREMFVCVYLDATHRVLAIHKVSVGTAGSGFVHPREIFLPAIALSASALIAVHNHPSGDPKPSVEDVNVTERLTKVGEILGITVLDHIIMGLRSLYSFADEQYHTWRGGTDGQAQK